jgi:hypothetical protein
MKRVFDKISPHMLLAAFVAAGMVIALVIVPDFGVSIDEGYQSDNARLSLEIYLNRLRQDPFEAFDQIGNANGVIKYYGSASLVVIRWLNEQFATEQLDRRFTLFHLGYFVIFQLGVVGMYSLSRRFLADWHSLLVAVLFGTQPLLWGHAFINPKDIPLLTAFIWVVAAGLRMVDGWRGSPLIASRGSLPRPLMILAGALGVFTLALWSSPAITRGVQQLVQLAYQAERQGLLSRLFSQLTTSGSLAGYQVLAHLYLLQVYKWLGILALLVVILLFIKAERAGAISRLDWIRLAAAAGIWGLAVSTRTAAIFAGGIIGLYALLRFGRKAVPGLTLYTLLAALVSYLAWPYLWVYGIRGAVDSLLLFSDHIWRAFLWFDGQRLAATELPRHYLPKLIAIQFTEPLLLLAVFGLIVFLFFRRRDREWDTKMVLLMLWLALPVAYVVLARPVMYNNFRQFLFITPPLFVLAGLGIEKLFGVIRPGLIRIALTVIVLLPGITGSVQLHPLQYSYYNQLVGGLSAAPGRYEVDYWDTGWVLLNELAREHIPAGSRVLLWRDSDFANRYFEERYSLGWQDPVLPIEFEQYDYALVKFDTFNANYFARYPVVAELEIGGIVLYTLYVNPDRVRTGP